MAEIKYLGDTTTQTVIDDNATLGTAARAAGDYDNGTELDLFAVAYLTNQYDATAPSAGDTAAYLYNLPGDGDVTTEVYPEGGDAAIGTDDDPQAIFLVATLVTVNPSITVDEVLASLPFQLYPDGNRFVLKNVSGQTFDLTWQLDIKPFKYQVV